MTAPLTPEAREALVRDKEIAPLIRDLRLMGDGLIAGVAYADARKQNGWTANELADKLEADGKRIAELEAMVATMQPEERCESCGKGRDWKYDSGGESKLCQRCYVALLTGQRGVK